MSSTTVSFKSTQGRLLLRSPNISDAANMLSRVTDPEVVKYLPHLAARPHTIETCEAVINRFRDGTFRTNVFLLVQRVDNGEVIGDGGLLPLDMDNKTAEAGVALNGGDARGQGYAVEALEAFLDYGFVELGLELIKLGTLEENVPMKTLLEKRLGLIGQLNEGPYGREFLFEVTRRAWIERKSHVSEKIIVVQ